MFYLSCVYLQYINYTFYIMIERINLLIKAKNITARQFAEQIGIQPSGMSHILSGRNNPSLDFVLKVVKRWPEVNINWLMLGKGEMYEGGSLSGQSGGAAVPEEQSLFVQPTAQPYSSGDFDLFSQPAPLPIPPMPASADNTTTQSEAAPSTPSVSSDRSLLEKNTVANGVSVETRTSLAEPTGASVSESSAEEVPRESADGKSMAMSSAETTPDRHIVPPNSQNIENRTEDVALDSTSPQRNLVKKRITKVIILYEDHSFAEYFPE